MTTSTKAKITVSIDRDALDEVRTAVDAGEASSVSAYIEHALRAQLAATTTFDTMLAEILTESGGAITPAERQAAQARLGAQRGDSAA